MKILVTGGAGFIGSHLVDAVVSAGHDVLVVDNLRTGRREHVKPPARLVELDITLPRLSDAAAEFRPEAVFHLAAQGEVRYSMSHPVDDARINILGSINLIECARKLGVKHFIFASSGGAIYGDTHQRPTPEDHPARPASPYGIGKLTVEHYLRVLGETAGMRTVALRYANVYGPRQRADGEAGVVAIFAHRLLHDKPVVINGDGSQTRDFVYVADVVAACLAALNADITGAFNIGTGMETSISALAEMMRAKVGHGSITHGSAKPGEQQTSCLDIHHATQLLQWHPIVTLEQGIATTVAWFTHRLP